MSSFSSLNVFYNCFHIWNQIGIKIAERHINNLKNADDTILMEEIKILQLSFLKNSDLYWRKYENY